MICDFHLHSSFSGDSSTPPENMIEQGIRLGLPAMCFTDHYDMDYPEEPDLFTFDINNYFQKLSSLKEQYKGRIDILIGIELGLQPHLKDFCHQIVSDYPFDFIIGSSHVADGMDPYYPTYYENRTEKAAYEAYFLSILDNLNTISNFDIYGHLDYAVRYGPNKNQFYSYEAYRDILDEILKSCIQKGIGIELNTGGLAYGLGFPHPHPDIIRQYRKLGGEIITVGSDGHTPEKLAYDFKKVPEFLKECGFSYYTIFKNRNPEFIKL